jgi:ribonuclease HII
MLQPFFSAETVEAGCDEAGRGCLAGPVFAAAVILPKDFYHPLLNDSKQVKKQHRDELREYIEHHALAWAVARVDNSEIDTINILNASFKAMHAAISAVLEKKVPELLLIDGHIFPAYFGIAHRCIVKGDAKYAPIAAASILAKTHRDEFMDTIHAEFPRYGWDDNRGYGTSKHLKMITENGLTPYHRKSFGICRSFSQT